MCFLWEVFCFNVFVLEVFEGFVDKELFDVGDNGVGNDKGCIFKGVMLVYVFRRFWFYGVFVFVG